MPLHFQHQAFCSLIVSLILVAGSAGARVQSGPVVSAVPRFGWQEVSLIAVGNRAIPYVRLEAEATLIEPDGRLVRRVPLFWDGGQIWRFRFPPDLVGIWHWTVRSTDARPDGRVGRFECVPSDLRGSSRPDVGVGPSAVACSISNSSRLRILVMFPHVPSDVAFSERCRLTNTVPSL